MVAVNASTCGEERQIRGLCPAERDEKSSGRITDRLPLDDDLLSFLLVFIVQLVVLPRIFKVLLVDFLQLAQHLFHVTGNLEIAFMMGLE